MAAITSNILQLTNISEAVFDASMEKHLDFSQESNLLRQFEINLLSPCTYLNNLDILQLKSIFFRAADWALYQVVRQRSPDSFFKVMQEHIGEDLLDTQQKLIIMDHLIIDYALANSGISGIDLKAAICATGITESKEMEVFYK